MFEIADVFLVLPGGYGTLDELVEVLSLTALQHHLRRPVVIVNDEGYFEPLLEFLTSINDKRFSEIPPRDLCTIVDDVDAAVAHLARVRAASDRARSGLV